MMEKDLRKILEGKFDPEQVAVLMEFALHLLQARETEEYKKLWSAINQFTQAVAELSMQMRALQTTLAEFSKTVERLSKEQEELKKTVAQLSKEMIELKNTVAQLSEEMEELKKTVAQLSKEMIELKNTVAELSKTVANLSGALERLQEEHKKTRQQLGGLSHTVGYVLEDRAYKHLPRLLKEDFGIEPLGRLKRGFIEFSESDYEEVNIFGKAKRGMQEVYILGEGKSQLTKKDIDTFLRKVDRLKARLSMDIFPLMVTYMVANPGVEKYARQKGVKLYYSYEFEE